EAPAGRDRRRRIAGMLRLAVLRLEQIHVAAAGAVEGMAARAGERPWPAGEDLAAAADGAEDRRRHGGPKCSCYDRRTMQVARREEIADADRPVLVAVPGGEFEMGSDRHLPNERPRHRVRI